MFQLTRAVSTVTVLNLARDYEFCDDENKRLPNRTFFTRIYLAEDGTLAADTVR